MQTVHLNIQDSVYDQFLGFLAKFKNNEMSIVDEKKIDSIEDLVFSKDKEEIQLIYDRYKSGNSIKYSQEEFESILNK